MQPFEYPAGHHFGCRIFQPFDFIEAVVVQFRVERSEDPRDLAVILYPAQPGIHGPFQPQNDDIRVPVHPATLVTGGNFRQPVRGIKGK